MMTDSFSYMRFFNFSDSWKEAKPTKKSKKKTRKDN